MIDFNGPLQCKNGTAVEIITTKGRIKNSVIGYIGDNIHLSCWAPDGTFEYDPQFDLINVPEEKTYWINVYDGVTLPEIYVHSSKEKADKDTGKNRVACIEIKYKKGEYV